jgi:predicted Zn-dependent protease
MKPPSPPDIERALKRPQPPNLAVARAMSPLRWALLVLVTLAAIGLLYSLKQQGAREQALLRQEQAVAAQAAQAQRKEIRVGLTRAYGKPSRNSKHMALVARVGDTLAKRSQASTQAKPLRFTLLAEPNALNVLGLGDGEVFITTALLNRMQTEGELAAALALGAAHALQESPLTALPNRPEEAPQWAYSKESAQKADVLALRLMSEAGYHPNAMLGMFERLRTAHQDGAQTAFFYSHPSALDRLEQVQATIRALYPNGIPEELSP